MILKSEDNVLIPKGAVLIGLHADSPQAHWDRLQKDLEDPQYKTPEGYPLVAVDYETYQVMNVYRAKYFEVETNEYLRKMDLHTAGKVKSKPSPPSDTKQMPFDFPNTMVSGFGICANSKRSFYINLGHRPEKGQMPVVPIPATREEVYKHKEKVRKLQNQFLKKIFGAIPEKTEFVAHNANYEYRVSMSNGFDFLWKDSTRYHGGIICSFLLAKLFKFQGRGLKGLVEKMYHFAQPEYLEAIAHTHLPKMLVNYFHSVGVGEDVTSDPGFLKRTAVLIRNIKFNANITFQNSMDIAYLDSFSVPHLTHAQFKKELVKMIKHVVANYQDMDQNSLSEVLPYAGQDPWWTLRLTVDLMKKAEGKATNSDYTDNLWDYYRKVEFPIIRLVADMAHTGMTLDLDNVLELQEKCKVKEAEYRLRFRNAAWRTFKSRFIFLFSKGMCDWAKNDKATQSLVNKSIRDRREFTIKPSKPSFVKKFDGVMAVKKWIGNMDALNTTQQKELFFDILGLPILKLTDKGKPSLDKKVLPRYEQHGEAAGALLDLRKVSQIYGLYARPYERLVHPETGRVHGILNLSGADTGRFTMAQPNLQQMSKFANREVEKDLTVRDLIIPSSKDRVLLAPDFSQIELRVMAYISGDKTMMECYTGDKDGKFIDIHTKTNQSVFNRELAMYNPVIEKKSYAKRAKFYRRVSKTINFLSQYGGGPGTLLESLLAEKMDFSLDDCKRFIDGFYRTYPGVKKYNEDYGGNKVAMSRVSLTDFGRPRFIEGYDEGEAWKVSSAERQANNHRVQGSAGDIMKVSMARIFWSEHLRKLGVVTLLTIHDELVLSIPRETFASSLKFIVDAYTKFNFPVPIRTSMDAGSNFGDLIALTETDDSSVAWEDVPTWSEKVTMYPFTEEDAKSTHVDHEMGDEEWING